MHFHAIVIQRSTHPQHCGENLWTNRGSSTSISYFPYRVYTPIDFNFEHIFMVLEKMKRTNIRSTWAFDYFSSRTTRFILENNMNMNIKSRNIIFTTHISLELGFNLFWRIDPFNAAHIIMFVRSENRTSKYIVIRSTHKLYFFSLCHKLNKNDFV